MSKNLNEEIPTGVSIESASYIENFNDISLDKSTQEAQPSYENLAEEYTPKLFSEEKNSEENEQKDNLEDKEKQLFDRDNEEEDFEIPAFLRRQKF